MSKTITNFMRVTVSVLGIGLLLCGRANAQACLGDCNGNGAVSSGELTKIIAIILNCDSMAAGCGAVLGGCVNADKNGNGIISSGELTNVISNILNFPNGCPPSTPGATNTVAPTNTPTRTFTPAAPSPTPTPTSAPACGNGVVEGDEECDQGGFCTGGTNAGTACTKESDCVGDGICFDGVKIGWVCSNNADCPGSTCIHCKTFGGKGCAANCTNETDVTYDLVTGQTTKLCLGGANDNKACAVAADCPSGQCILQVKPGTTGSFVHDGFVQLALPLKGFQTSTFGKLRGGRITSVIKTANSELDRVQVGQLACACVRSTSAKSCGGTLFEKDGTGSIDCTPDYSAGDSACAGKKPCSFVHGDGNATSSIFGCSAAGLEGINLMATQASNGQTAYRSCIGGANDGHTCSVPADCTGAPCHGGANDGKPCTTSANCPGGACGCVSVPPPTPPTGAGLAFITLQDSGPAGSAIVLNSSAIGTVTGLCTCSGLCTGGTHSGAVCIVPADCPGGTCTGCPSNPNVAPLYGPDHEFCTADDPQSARGQPSTLPQVTGKATGIITNTMQSVQTHYCQNNRTKTCTKDADCGADGPCTYEIGPYSYTGALFDCSKLTGSPPSSQSGAIAGAFTQLNQTGTGDIVVRNIFVPGAPRP